MNKPPEVFADRAAEIVMRAGETSTSRDSIWFFAHDDRLLHSRSGDLSHDAVGALRPGLIHFIWRRSPSRLTPREMTEPGNDVFIFQSGRVTLNDPPLDVAGSATVVLDHHGGLVSYAANPSASGRGPDWRPLLESTGIDLRTLHDAEPIARPPVPSDRRAAWTGSYPGQPERVRIEAASLHGSPAWVRVFAPWSPATARRALPNPWATVAPVRSALLI